MTSSQAFFYAMSGQVTAISAAAALMIRLARRNAALRHTIALLGLILLLGSPLWTRLLPQANWLHSDLRPDARANSNAIPLKSHISRPVINEFDAAVSPAYASAATAVKPVEAPVAVQRLTETELRPAQFEATLQSSNAISTQNSNGAISRNWLMNLACAVWLVGAVMMASRWAWQQCRLQRLARTLSLHPKSESVVDGSTAYEICSALNLKRLPPVAVSDLVPIPMVLGIWQPGIVLPSSLLAGDATRLRDVLIHECAHVARHDAWVNAAQRVAGVLWWWHPGVTWLNRQLTRSREEICDNFVLRYADASSYALTLLELAEQCSGKKQIIPELGLLGNSWTLAERISGLLEPERNTMTHAKRWTVVMTTVVLAAMCFLVGGVRAVDKPGLKPQSTSPIANNKVVAEQAPVAPLDPNLVPKLIAAQKPAITRDPAVVTRKTVVRGDCSDEDSKPLAGAHVKVYWNPGWEHPLGLLAETKSDSKGNFELHDVETESPDRWDLVVIAMADNHVPTVNTPHTSSNGVIDLSLELSSNPATLSGIVTDSDGRPIKDAQVFKGINHPFPGIWNSVTDEYGRFAMTDFPRWTPESSGAVNPGTTAPNSLTRSSVTLKHPEYAQTKAWYTAIPQVVHVILQPPAIVEGQVIDAVTNQPAANVVVSAQGVARRAWNKTQTDNNGRYRMLLPKDHYNIWAEAPERTCAAINTLRLELGKSVTNADIRLITGGFVVGTLLGLDGTPMTWSVPPVQIESPENGPADPVENRRHKLSVAHHGPARLRTGAAVTSTELNADGTYRLRVAPGKNHIYVMNASADPVDVFVEEGKEVTVNFRLGKETRDGFSQPDAELEFAAKLRLEAEAEDAGLINDYSQSVPSTSAAAKRSRSATSHLLDRLREQNARDEAYSDSWCQTLKGLVDLGPVAVPELIAVLDVTNDERMLRCLGFVLRAINDKRAVPALIRAIPRTILHDWSDMGCRSDDPILMKFMQQQDLDDHDDENRYGFGRPIREIFGALHKLTGQKFDEEQLYHLSHGAHASQQQMKQNLIYQTARKWSDWWEWHWSEHLQDATYLSVNLQKPIERSVEPPDLRMRFTYGSGIGNWFVESVLDPNSSHHIFLDLDTGRTSSLPSKWRKAKDIETHLDDIVAWAGREGFDIFGTEYVSPHDGLRYFALRPIGLRAWELDSVRLMKLNSHEFTMEQLQSAGSPTEGLLLHFDRKSESFDPKASATFVYVTREGTPGLLNVGSDDASDRTEIHNRQFGWTELTEAKKPAQP